MKESHFNIKESIYCDHCIFYVQQKYERARFSNSQLSQEYKPFLAWFMAISEYDPLISGKSLQGLSSAQHK